MIVCAGHIPKIVLGAQEPKVTMEFYVWRINLVLVFLVTFSGVRSDLNTDIDDAIQFLKEYDKMAADMEYEAGLVDWAYSTNITEYNRERQVILSYL